MKECRLGRRSKCLRLITSTHRSKRELEDAVSLLRAPRALLEDRMEATLARVRARALRTPAHAANQSAWERVRGLDDLAVAPCSSSDVLPKMTDQVGDWSRWNADGDAVMATAATSGSSGMSRVMPFAQWSVDYYAWSCLPHLAQVTLERAMPAKRVVLALSAPKGYVTYLVMPPVFAAAGYDVLHVPLALILRDPKVALDLIDWLLEPANAIHATITVPTMLPLLIAALEELPGGADALNKMSLSLRLLCVGGSEFTLSLERSLSARLGLRSDAYMNLFASTEGGHMACSWHDFSIFHGSLHSHVLSIMPLQEVEKAESDPDYCPKGMLLTRAPVGLIGELASTYDGVVPWINLRQGDIFEVVEPGAETDVPRLRYVARLSSVQDVGGGRVWPASYRCAMDSLGGKVTDYLAMALKPGEMSPDGESEILVKDKLFFYYEGTACPEEVAASIFEAIPMLETTGPQLGQGTFDMAVCKVRTGALRQCRQRKSQERGDSPGPLKHQVVRGPQYQVPINDVLASTPGWIPAPRWSGIRPTAPQAEQRPEAEKIPQLAALPSWGKDKAG